MELEPLTTKEIAELRGWVATCAEIRGILRQDTAGPNDPPALVARLLDEVEHVRMIRRVVGHCQHDMEHAPYCAGCCAQFDPGRMVLIHESTCRFRGHERAAP